MSYYSANHYTPYPPAPKLPYPPSSQAPYPPITISVSQEVIPGPAVSKLSTHSQHSFVIKNDREETEKKNLTGLIVVIVVMVVLAVVTLLVVDPRSKMATDKAWCGTRTEDNQAPLDQLILRPGGNDVTFFGGRYYAEFNPQVSSELACSIDVKGEVDENHNFLTKIPEKPDLIKIF